MAEAAPATEVVNQYLMLKDELLVKASELKTMNRAFLELKSEHLKAMHKWELEKENIKNTTTVVEADVAEKREELLRMERETQELRRKVEERRRRNEEHQLVLQKRKQIVDVRVKEANEKDAAASDRLATFQRSRDEAREQLQAAVQKFETVIPQEQAAHAEKMRHVKSRIAETLAAIEAEAKSWALEQAMKEWNEKSQARKHILDEVAASEEGKDLWADLLQEANCIHVHENLKILAELRAMVSV